MTYEEAYLELSELLDQIDQGDIPLQDLPASVKRASELISYCKTRLRDIETQVDTLFYDEEE